jgi:hypothetical protein
VQALARMANSKSDSTPPYRTGFPERQALAELSPTSGNRNRYPRASMYRLRAAEMQMLSDGLAEGETKTAILQMAKDYLQLAHIIDAKE